MKDILKLILVVLAVEGVHVLLLTGAFCGLGLFVLNGGDTPVTFRGLLWTGTVAFWLDGYGPLLLGCLTAVGAWVAWDVYVAWLGLKKRKEVLDQEVERRANNKVSELEPRLTAAIEEAYEREYAMREQSLRNDCKRINELETVLKNERRELEAKQLKLREQEYKVEFWYNELQALRDNAVMDKEKRQALKQRVRWAAEALNQEPSNTGLALRHLGKAEKI